MKDGTAYRVETFGIPIKKTEFSKRKKYKKTSPLFFKREVFFRYRKKQAQPLKNKSSVSLKKRSQRKFPSVGGD
jgi:hypothetical protein